MKISVCMITKNEERYLAQCLDSVHPYVDEIILTDTGSTDQTLLIASSYKKVCVTHFPWNGSFADARNASLQAATGDWILVIDADEVLAKESGERLRTVFGLLEKNKISAAFMEIYNASTHAPADEVLSGKHLHGSMMMVPRLLENLPEIYFEGTIHENFGDAVTKARLGLGETDLKLVHYGAMEDVRKSRNKVERNVLALLNEITKDPKSVWYYGYLAMELQDFPDLFPEEVLEMVTEEGWKHVQESNYRTSIVRLGLIRAHGMHRRNNYPDMLATVKKVEMTDGPSADMDFLAGSAHQGLAKESPDGSPEQMRHLLEAEQRFKFAVTNPKKDAFIKGSGSFLAINQLGWISYAFAEFDAAKQYWTTALSLDPTNESALKGLRQLSAEVSVNP